LKHTRLLICGLMIPAMLLCFSCNGTDTDKTADSSADKTAEKSPVEKVIDPVGEKLYKTKTCFTCHGADGKTPILPEYPKIAGQGAAYALQQMKDIKSGARANGMTAAMKGVMHLVNDEEMETLAKYVEKLAP
jgi:cytochrome c